MKNIKWWEEQPKLWKKFVPNKGQANTIQGELIRCIGKATDEAYRNGNANWDLEYERLIKFVEIVLIESDTFNVVEKEKISKIADKIILEHETPDLSHHGSTYYYLTEMVVRWCIANPDSLEHKIDPTLKR